MPPVFLCPVSTVVYCDTNHVSVGVFRWHRTRWACEQLLTERVAPDGIGSEDQLAEILRRLRDQAGKTKEAVLVLPSAALLCRQISLPEKTRGRWRRALAAEIGRLLPGFDDVLIWSAVRQDRETKRYSVTLAQQLRVESCCAAIEKAGWRLASVIPAPAAVRMLVQPRVRDDEMCVAVVVEESAACCIVVGRRWHAPRTFRFIQSEKNPVAGLVREVTRTLLQLRRDVSDLNLTRVLLSAPAEHWGETVEALTQSLGLPVQALDSSDHGDYASGDEVNGPDGTLLLGGIVAAQGKDLTQIELWPEARRRRRDARARRPWLASAAVLALAGLLLPTGRYLAEATREEAERVRIERELSPQRERVAETRRQILALSGARSELGQWHALAERRTAWVRFLDDLDARFDRVEGAGLDAIEVLLEGAKDSLKVRLSGEVYLLSGGTGAAERFHELVAELEDSPFVASVQTRRIEMSEGGRVRFDLALVNDRLNPL